MAKAVDWAFIKRLRRGSFGWRDSQLAAERISEALAEIRAAHVTIPHMPQTGRSGSS